MAVQLTCDLIFSLNVSKESPGYGDRSRILEIGPVILKLSQFTQFFPGTRQTLLEFLVMSKVSKEMLIMEGGFVSASDYT